MNTIHLEQWQADHFAEHGAITVLVPLETQPPSGTARIGMHPNPAKNGRVLFHDEHGCCVGSVPSSYTIGEVVRLSQQIEANWDHVTPARVASIEYVDVREIDADTSAACGMVDEGYGFMVEALKCNYEETNGPDKPHAWAVRLEKS